MTNVKEVDTQLLISKAAEEMEKIEELRPPEFASYVKTGVGRMRPPTQRNWWYLRSAAVLRKIYLQEMGVSRLRKLYGNRKNRGHKPEHKRKASGAVIRRVLQHLEKAGFVKIEKGKGRRITPKGQKFLDAAAKAVAH